MRAQQLSGRQSQPKQCTHWGGPAILQTPHWTGEAR